VRRTVLGEDVQALLHAQGGVEDYKAVADREHVIAGPGLEEGANRALRMSASVYRPLSAAQCPTRPSSCSRSSAVNVRGGRIGRACSSNVRGETKVGRASLGRASVSPDMVAAMLAKFEPEPHGGMCAARRRSVDSREVGRACALIVGNAAKLRSLQTTMSSPVWHGPFNAGHPSHIVNDHTG
jgi:hypothetical protein